MLQEALSTKRFGAGQDRFPFLETLNAVQSLVCFLWAAALLLVFPGKKGARPASAFAYLKPAVSNSIGPACGFMALRNISYPAQVSAQSVIAWPAAAAVLSLALQTVDISRSPLCRAGARQVV